MAIKKNKNGIVFSIMALFLTILLFTFASVYYFQSNYSQISTFKNARVSQISNSIHYFKNIYLPSAEQFSLLSTLSALLNNKSILLSLDKNYSKLNKLIYDGMTNASFNGIKQINLKDKTVYYLTNLFIQNFNQNKKGNFSFKIKGINIYEDHSFYINLAIDSEYNITTSDNISYWNFNYFSTISVPIYSLKDPQFFIYLNKNYLIRPAQLYTSFSTWTLESFNSTINNVYATSYYDKTFLRTLGSSFLFRLLNISTSFDYGLVGLWNFANPYLGIVDSSSNNIAGKFLSNSILLTNFENSSIKSNKLYNLAGYNLIGNIIPGVNCKVLGIYLNGCFFNGSGSINYAKNNFNLENLSGQYKKRNQISISAWIKPVKFSGVSLNNPSLNTEEIFRYANASTNIIFLRIRNRTLQLGVGNGLSVNLFNSIQNISLNNWTYVTATFNGNTGNGKLYINGKLILNKNETPVSYFKSSNTKVTIGSFDDLSEFFNGTIDSFAIYDTILNQTQINNLYNQKKVINFNYITNSYLGSGITFNGRTDFVNITNSENKYQFGIKPFSYCIWFKVKSFPNSSSSAQLIMKRNPSDDFELQLNTKKLAYYFVNSGSSNFNISKMTLSLNKVYFACVTRNNSLGSLYINGKLDDNIFKANIDISSNSNLYFGHDIWVPNGEYFNGTIYSVAIYNRSLTSNEINSMYYNYPGFVDGTSNYITLINPEKMGLKTSENISHDSSIFFNINFNNKKYNLSLWNVTNITSENITIPHYNFLVDSCMNRIFSIPGFSSVKTLVHIGAYGGNCSNLVKAGFY